jgi:hypothetical protein
MGTANQAFLQEPVAVAKASAGHYSDKVPGTSRSFVFQGYSRDYELARITSEMAGPHLLGESAAKKVYLLDELYTSEVPVVPGNPQSKTIVKKPVIYAAVKRIEKYLMKSVKKGVISTESATEEFNRVLDVALSILSEDTRQFENEIEALHDEATRIDLFTKKVNLNY